MARLLPLLFLAGPGLPIGAFAWSQGMAGAIAQGLITGGGEVGEWLAGVLEYGYGRFELPLFVRCFRAARREDGPGLAAWSRRLLAGRETAELWEEERRLGASLTRLLADQGLLPGWSRGLELGHAAAFALAAAVLTRGEGEEGALMDSLRAFAWNWLENQVAAAARALPLGQTEGVRILLELMPKLEETAAGALDVPEDRIGSSLPGLSLVSMAHEDQPSRLFRS
ncbi:MAG: urease accessory protein UreF [Planctomycetota bacterium]|jgi:urease accessory protein|nr:urease accessory protein UreF [Planctomycetota bacterium]